MSNKVHVKTGDEVIVIQGKNSAVPYSLTQFLRYGERSDGDNATYLRIPLITLLEITLDDGVKTSGDIVQLHESHTVTVKLGFNAKVIPKRLQSVYLRRERLWLP